MQWYELSNPEQVDSPALLIYPERIAANIRSMIHIAGDAQRLIPHVKTHKMEAIVKMQVQQGITRFKCATIAEAEMAALGGATYVLIAHQLPEPKAERLIQLVRQYPKVRFASLVDNLHSAALLSRLFGRESLEAVVWIDVDNGMHRSGLPADDQLPEFYRHLLTLPHIYCEGLHVYDGHIRDVDPAIRKQHCENDFRPVEEALDKIKALQLPALKVIAGGTPTFTIHALYPERYCSPGTCLLWDEGYGSSLKEQPFLQAAVILTRIISKPLPGIITTDLGHKGVAAENPVDKRIFFFDIPAYTVTGQSEEHLVLKVPEESWQQYQVGDVLYGVPYHICPTVALYNEVQVVKEGRVTDQWKVTARGRKINI